MKTPFAIGSELESEVDALLSADEGDLLLEELDLSDWYSDIDDEISPWTFENSLTASYGYTDNVYYGAFAREESSFARAELEFFALRFPEKVNEPIVTILVIGEHKHYFQTDALDKERFGFVYLSLQDAVSQNTRLTTALSAAYFEQFYDLNLAEILGNPSSNDPALSEAQNIIWDNALDWTITSSDKIKFSFGVDRQIFVGTSSDYTAPYSEIEYTRKLGQNTTLSVGYQFTVRMTDESLQQDLTGSSILDTRATYYLHEPAVSWEQVWLEGDLNISSESKLALRFFRDNGEGFRDYNRYRLEQRIEAEFDKWSFELSGVLTQYAYLNQSVLTNTERLRSYANFGWSSRLSYTFNDAWECFLQYNFERSDSTQVEDEFNINTAAVSVVRYF